MEINHAHFLKRAFSLAWQSRENGNHPFGAVLVIDDQVVVEGLNTVMIDRDVTRHAELNLVSEATRKFTANQLMHSTIYASTEPCAMCSGAIFWSGIRCVVYGCSAVKMSELANGKLVTHCRDILSQGTETTLVEGPLFEKEGLLVHQGFWT